MRRRHFLTLSPTTIGGLLVYSLDGKPFRIAAQEKALRIPLRFFDEREALIVAAAASRVIPSDDSGPGAKEAGVVIYIDRLKNLAGFESLEPAEQDEKLKQIESSMFFSLLRQHTIEGMFCDPMHGGNIDMVGRQLVGFPGPQGYLADTDKHFGEAFRPKPVRLEGGHPMEDEQ